MSKKPSSLYVKNLGKIKPLVKEILETNMRARDNDNYLTALIWKKQLKYPYISVQNFLASYLAEGKMISAESIRRCRQKIQEDFPHTRGKKYLERHKEYELVTKEIHTV
jgi:hypothetical protein